MFQLFFLLKRLYYPAGSGLANVAALSPQQLPKLGELASETPETRRRGEYDVIHDYIMMCHSTPLQELSVDSLVLKGHSSQLKPTIGIYPAAIYLSIYPSIYLFVYLSVDLSI